LRRPATSSEKVPRWLTKAYTRLVAISRQMGADVKVGDIIHSGEFQAETMCITMKRGLSPRDRINYLLHEMGHVSIYQDGLTETRYHGETDSPDIPARLSLLDEEFEAWDRGRSIAAHARIPLDQSFNDAMVHSMTEYVKWVLDTPREFGVTTIDVNDLPQEDPLKVAGDGCDEDENGKS